MKIRLIWVGKTKERFIAEGLDKYLKMLGPYAKIEVVQVKEHKGGTEEQRRREEGKRILKHSGAFVLLDERGRATSSTGFAATLKDCPGVDFVIGGPYGVSDDVARAASDVMSLSSMTFTHDIARLVLVEQLYRAMTINRGGGYHH